MPNQFRDDFPPLWLLKGKQHQLVEGCWFTLSLNQKRPTHADKVPFMNKLEVEVGLGNSTLQCFGESNPVCTPRFLWFLSIQVHSAISSWLFPEITTTPFQFDFPHCLLYRKGGPATAFPLSTLALLHPHTHRILRPYPPYSPHSSTFRPFLIFRFIWSATLLYFYPEPSINK